MTKLRKTLALSGIIALAAAGLGSTSPAAASADECYEGYFCMWSEPNYTGEFLQLAGGVDFLGRPPMDMNDKISSFMNLSEYPVELYVDAYGSGEKLYINRGASIADLNVFNDFNNRASSLVFVGKTSD